MKGFRKRGVCVLATGALGLSGIVLAAEPASAAVVGCGDVITTSISLSQDVGPCTGNGIVIGASGITVNLNGKSIIGRNTTNMTANEQVGVFMQGKRNVTIINGTVRNFDAGVAIVKGSKNQLRKLTVRDNVNHSSLTGAINKCTFGDGVVVKGSEENLITQNTAHRNGPFSGITLINGSDNNIVSGNEVFDQNIQNRLPGDNPDGTPRNGPCGPFSATATGVGRLNQDIGIRVEGPGSDNNQVLSNSVHDNQLDGITIHGYVCIQPTPPGVTGGTPNTGNLIQGNDVRRNGFANVANREFQDGIAILSQGPLGTVTCSSNNNRIIGNVSNANARDGISVAATGDNAIPSANEVSQNTVNDNGRNGIFVRGPFTVCPPGQRNATPPDFCNVPREPRNGANENRLVSNKGMGNGNNVLAPALGYDGFDGNPACDKNFWAQNIFGTVNQACVAANFGTGTELGPVP